MSSSSHHTGAHRPSYNGSHDHNNDFEWDCQPYMSCHRKHHLPVNLPSPPTMIVATKLFSPFLALTFFSYQRHLMVITILLLLVKITMMMIICTLFMEMYSKTKSLFEKGETFSERSRSYVCSSSDFCKRLSTHQLSSRPPPSPAIILEAFTT